LDIDLYLHRKASRSQFSVYLVQTTSNLQGQETETQILPK
jgi:hypothetical protein